MESKRLGKISLILVGIGVIISIFGMLFISSSAIKFLFSNIKPLLIYLIFLLIPLILSTISIKKKNKVLGILSIIFAIIFIAIASILSFTEVLVFY